MIINSLLVLLLVLVSLRYLRLSDEHEFNLAKVENDELDHYPDDRRKH
jgi:hypothetical protein